MQSQNERLILYQRYLDLIHCTNQLSSDYPKSVNLTLIAKAKESLYSGFRNMAYAFRESNEKEKIDYLNNLVLDLTLQKKFIESAYLAKYISKHHYETWHTIITDISNIVNDWIITDFTA